MVLAVAPCYLKKIQREYLELIEEGEEDSALNQHHELFEDYRPNSSSLMYPIIFLLRRYGIIVVLITMPQLKYAQILSQFFLTMVVITHLWSYRPYDSLFVNRQELINEHMVMLAAYPLYCFTPWVWDTERRMEAGWLIVAVILINILFNISLLVY